MKVEEVWENQYKILLYIYIYKIAFLTSALIL